MKLEQNFKVIWVNKILTVALVVVFTFGLDAEDFWGGEEDIWEGGLDTLARVGVGLSGLVETLGVSVHELNPDFLNGTVLAEVELVVGLEKSADFEDTATNLWTTVTGWVAPRSAWLVWFAIFRNMDKQTSAISGIERLVEDKITEILARIF